MECVICMKKMCYKIKIELFFSHYAHEEYSRHGNMVLSENFQKNKLRSIQNEMF